MVETRCARGVSQGHYGRGLAGGTAQEYTVGTSWINIKWQGKGVRETGDVQLDILPQGRSGLSGELGIDGCKRCGAGLSSFLWVHNNKQMILRLQYSLT